MNILTMIPASRRRVTTDPDADALIAAIEAADAESLESSVRNAINDFVAGCKVDESQISGLSNWEAMNYLFVAIGPRTIPGVAIPWRNTNGISNAPITGNLVRKTGYLQGDAFLPSVGFNSYATQNNASIGCWLSDVPVTDTNRFILIGGISMLIGPAIDGGGARFRANSGSLYTLGNTSTNKIYAWSRGSSDNFQWISGTSTGTQTDTSSGLDTGTGLIMQYALRYKFAWLGRAVDLPALKARLEAYDAVIQAL